MDTKICVTGPAGRMGRAVVHAIHETEGVCVGGSVERSGHALIGEDVGVLVGIPEIEIPVWGDLDESLGICDMLIDFTTPEATLKNLEVCNFQKKPAIVGSTGFTPEQMEEVHKYAKRIPIVLAPNMSVGVNACFELLKEAVKVLGDGYDVEIVELHHNKKKDSPSGTAVRMGEVVADALGRNYREVANYHREGMCGERTKEEIGMQTVRGGDIVGEHTVYFIGQGERIEITHRAMSRDMFARGAVRAAKWIKGQAPGVYDMQDVMGLGKK